MGACLGVLFSSLGMSAALFFMPLWGPIFIACLLISIASGLSSHLEKNKPLIAIVWNVSTLLAATTISYFLAKILFAQ
jgi:VIT1/CCC1 family predicted Fe2+/Mn2+ transporter